MAPNKTQQWLQNRRDDIQNAEYDERVQRAIIDFLDAYNPDNVRLEPPRLSHNNRREETLATSSRLAYASTLHRTAQQFDLLTVSARELNQLASDRLMGDHETVDADGVSQNTVHQNQIAWRSFYQFHQNHPKGVEVECEPDEITLVDREETAVDERDMFTSKEVQQMRDACQNNRDRALLEMLIYTGQRHSALRKLTVDDVHPEKGESGILYLPESEGMKGADGKRPLLGAQKHARKWKRSHPTGNPDDAFFTHIYDWSGHDDIEPGDRLSRQTFGDIPKRIADRAGVEKPANPHNFRHYFTHSAIANHGMSMDTVRHLLGHSADSRELERTYQHLVDDDYIESAELDMGIRDEREESLTPTQCFTCDEPLQPSWSVCPNCERVYGPNAERMKDEVEQRETDGALAATTPEQKDAVETVIELLDDPDTLNQLVTLSEELDTDDPEDVFTQFEDVSR